VSGNEQKITVEEAVRQAVETWERLSQHASDIAYARRCFYEAYIAEGFSPSQALDLCKTI
jgi:hypothetical protein